ncbi:MAG: hypothetical protein IKS65_07955 [Bacteroidales bacterium]|nr:hypothetical protein [Bacteroidales bacterium]
MDNKLDLLTKKIYEQGVEKANHDAVEIVENAKKEAEKIVNDAKAEAERIVNQANKEAEELKTKVTADVKMAATQSIAVTKQEIEKMIVMNAAENGVKASLSSAEFVKELVKDVVRAFNPDNASPVALDFILPESMKAGVEPFVKNEISKMFKAEVRVEFSKKMNGGFKVAPQDGGYLLQFTDDEFTQLIASYLRPATKKILFG